METISPHSIQIARFWSKVNKGEECWEWIDRRNDKGYGIFFHEGKDRKAHRVSYAWAKGSIPHGLEIDHMCHNRACVNPDHLRTVTGKQNHENRAGAQQNSRSGVRGVFWVKRRNRWCAQVGSKHVGSYLTMDEAEAAVIAKRNELYTHNLLDRIPA